jgi:hypothetical protein
MKGCGEIEAVVQFAIDSIGNPRINELTEEKWKLLDEALPDIPNSDDDEELLNLLKQPLLTGCKNRSTCDSRAGISFSPTFTGDSAS